MICQIKKGLKESAAPVLAADSSVTVELRNPTKIATVGDLTKLAS